MEPADRSRFRSKCSCGWLVRCRIALVRLRVFTAGLVVCGCLCLGLAVGASAKSVWLCLPGHHPDPCTPGLSTTVYSPTFKQLGVQHPKAVKHPAIDCF